MNSDDDTAAARQLLDLINGSWVAQACYVTARLGIADLLAAGPRTAEDLAALTATNAAALRRLLSALGSVDICHQRDDGAFEMTRMGALLRADVPCSMRAWALQWGGEAWQVWANLLHSIKTGQSARSLITGDTGIRASGARSAGRSRYSTRPWWISRAWRRWISRALTTSQASGSWMWAAAMGNCWRRS